MKTGSIVVICMLIISCSQNVAKDKIEIPDNIDESTLGVLKEKKIYFGHQSVGYNIIDGLNELVKLNEFSSIQIIEGRKLELFDKPVLAHSKNGMNRDPNAKIRDFQQTILGGVGEKVDIAGFKFCYVDFDKETDVEKLFNQYKITMEEIKTQYPQIRLIHFTVPLRSVDTGFKGRVNRILGRDIQLMHNSVRQKYNELLVEEYDANEVFDIARLESTFPDGQRNFKKMKGDKIYCLVPEYSSDGGHLSNIGAKYIAYEFLVFLSERYE